MFKVERSLSDAIVQYIRLQTNSRIKNTIEERVSTLTEAIGKVITYLSINDQHLYLISTVEMDKPSNRGEYVQISIATGLDLISALKSCEEISVGITNPENGIIASVLAEVSDEFSGFDFTLDTYEKI